MKITIDAKNLDGPKPVISVKVEDDDPEVKKFFEKLHTAGPEKDQEEDEEKRFIYWWNFSNRYDGLTMVNLEVDTGDVEKLKEILSPFYFG